MTDLDRYTKDQLSRMAIAAGDAAVVHYTRATQLVAESASIPYTDEAAYNRHQDRWRAAMAAGNEQEELCHQIGQELAMRSVCDA